jgi:hypothetical protein
MSDKFWDIQDIIVNAVGKRDYWVEIAAAGVLQYLVKSEYSKEELQQLLIKHGYKDFLEEI